MLSQYELKDLICRHPQVLLAGVVTLQDVMETMDAEMNEDYAKLGGLSAEEDLEEPVKFSIRKRLPWLY